jgi:hypothetical protein
MTAWGVRHRCRPAHPSSALSVDAERHPRALGGAYGARLHRVVLPMHRQLHDGLRDALPGFGSPLIGRKSRPGVLQRDLHQAKRFGIEFSVRDQSDPP